MRLAWESPYAEISPERRWVHFAKGGEYSPFYDDIHLLVGWDRGTAPLREAGAYVKNQSYYLRQGVTYSQRSTSAFNPKVLPKGCIFSTGGHGVFSSNSTDPLAYLALLVSRIVNLQIEMAVGSGDDAHSGSAARNYLNGMVNRLRCPSPSCAQIVRLSELVIPLVNLARQKTTWDETSRLFVMPHRLGFPVTTLASLCEDRLREEEEMDVAMIEGYAILDEYVSVLFGLSEVETQELDTQVGGLVGNLPSTKDIDTRIVHDVYLQEMPDLIESVQKEQGSARFISKKTYISSRRLELASRLVSVHPRKVVEARRLQKLAPKEKLSQVAVDVVSYAVGLSFGRWDIRCATHQSTMPFLPHCFDPLPVGPPGMLHGQDGLPSRHVPEKYPIEIDCDGILVDDPAQSHDVMRRMRECLEVIWNDRTEAIEKEACEILGMKELRDYFRKLGKGGYWDDHVSRYSKSRRKAPIYWLLQTSKKNYALWLYYQRLDKDLLFKALVNYVEPKIRLEESLFETLRAQKATAGGSGRNAKRLGKEVERQEEFLSELRDFEDKLRRTANLHLEPDLNDGVALNIAPLWQLVPWKEAKNCWEELLEGKYEWSSIGKQLRKKGVVK